MLVCFDDGLALLRHACRGRRAATLNFAPRAEAGFDRAAQDVGIEKRREHLVRQMSRRRTKTSTLDLFPMQRGSPERGGGSGLADEYRVARSERFELPTLGIEIRCSIQLSYER